MVTINREREPVKGSPEELMTFYNTLVSEYGHQGWWPSDSWFETIVGAILAQNVSWTGASKAVSALKESGILCPEILAVTDRKTIAELIYSSRYYNQKTDRLLNFVHWFMDQYNGNRILMEHQETQTLRVQLLSLSGFGPETVDSILLYACNKPVFVVDAYTRRIGSRIGWYSENASYLIMQEYFSTRITSDIPLLKDFHAQMVNLGNKKCRSVPLCDSCQVNMISGERFCIYAEKNMVQIHHDKKKNS